MIIISSRYPLQIEISPILAREIELHDREWTDLFPFPYFPNHET